MKLIILLLCCLYMYSPESTAAVITSNFKWKILEKISCYYDDVKFWMYGNKLCDSDNDVQCGFSRGSKHLIIDIKTYENAKSRVSGFYNDTGFGVKLENFTSDDIGLTYDFSSGFNQYRTHKLTYSDVFGELNGKPCDKFDEEGCTICSLPKKELFLCKDTGYIKKQFICNGELDCADGSDERINGTNPTCYKCDKNNTALTVSESLCDGEFDCIDGRDEINCCEGGLQSMNNSIRICEKKGDPSTKLFVCKDGLAIKNKYHCDGKDDCFDGSDEGLQCSPTNTDYNIGALAVGATLLVAGVSYGVMLVKNKNKKSIKSTSVWLLSPFTNSLNYLLSFCGHKKSGATDDIEEREFAIKPSNKTVSELETDAMCPE